MEKFQKINSELFAPDAIAPEKMSNIFGGIELTAGGSKTADFACGDNCTSSITRTWTSDNADGSWNGVNVGPDVGASVVRGGGGVLNYNNSHVMPFPTSGGVVIVNVGTGCSSNTKNTLRGLD